jgi:multiple sugar transport system permease protein
MTAMRQPSSAQAPRTGRSRLARRERNWGLIFLAPWICGFILFYAGPMIASLIFSFTAFDVVNPENTRFVGLENWQRMLSDPIVGKSLLVTLRFMLIGVPLGTGLALLLAVLLNAQHLWGKRFFRTLFFMPVMIPFVAGTIIWLNFFNAESGWLNLALEQLGIVGPDWIRHPHWIIFTLSLMGIWGVGNAMLILLAGLQGVPTELYEAARVDGAGPVYTFFRITIPLISPVLFFNIVLAVIGGFQEFLRAYVMFDGTAGPNDVASFYMFKLYKEAFVYFNMGYASTLAWGMFIIALLITLALFAGAQRWVYYAGGEA